MGAVRRASQSCTCLHPLWDHGPDHPWPYGFCVGLLAHQLTGFSEGGVILLAVMAASSSDISGPPTMRTALPEANSSAYVGTSTGLGTPVVILIIPLFMALAELMME